MLLATLVVLFQFPLASAGKLPVPPQPPATVLFADNLTAKLTPTSPSDNFLPPPTTADLFDRDKIRLVDFPSADLTDGTRPARKATDGSSPGSAKPTAMAGPPEESSSLLAEVHIPTRVDPPAPSS